MLKNIPSTEDKLYNTKEIANILKVTRRTIYRWIGEGRIKPLTTTKSGRIYFGLNEIYEYLYPNISDNDIQSPINKVKNKLIRPKYERFI